MIEKRAEYANLLGYDSMSHYVLEKRMAKSPKHIEKILEDLHAKIFDKGQAEIEELTKLKREETHDPEAVIHSWDRQFYANLRKERTFNIDEREISQYFQTDHVMQEILNIYQELFGLRFERVSAENCQIWHEDVECYEVFDNRDNNSLGHFYLDLYERVDKNMSAACRPLHKSSQISDNESENYKPSAVLICNLSKPKNLGAK